MNSVKESRASLYRLSRNHRIEKQNRQSDQIAGRLTAVALRHRKLQQKAITFQRHSTTLAD
jgi:hypothetical protein